MSDTPTQRAIANVKVDCDKIVNRNTGEMLSKPESVEIGTIAPEIFVGISTLDISKEISDKLTQAIPLDGIEIKPTGQIYLCHIQYRRMLNDAFGMGNWALRPLGGFQRTVKKKKQGEEEAIIVCREYALYIRGKYASSAIGEQEYIESNDMMSASDACEGTESNAIMRCCKKLGIGLEMWDKKFVAKFIKEYCVQVWRKVKSKPQWRLKESEPFFDETGIIDPTKKQIPVTEKKQTQFDEPGPAEIQQNKIITIIEKITSKPGVGKDKKDKEGNVIPGKPYTRYTIYGEGNIKYSTFDKALAGGAKTAKEAGLKVSIVTKGDEYNSIVSLNLLEPDFSDPAASQNPESSDLLSEQDDINQEALPF